MVVEAVPHGEDVDRVADAPLERVIERHSLVVRLVSCRGAFNEEIHVALVSR
jgi:hypothetical protein